MFPAEAEAFLLALPRFAGVADAAYKPGFARIEPVLAAMGDPHRAYRAIHVAGTNGKGSTASMAAALLGTHGYRTGLHTSPHLWHLAERMRVAGIPAPGTWIADAVTRYADVLREAETSFFEATVALSLLYFAEARVDVAVVEVGLGGRLDATNVVDAAASLVTSIALDHTELLGDTLGAIAREKAGIFRPGVPAFTNADAEEALDALRGVAEAKNTPLEAVQGRVQLEAHADGLAIITPLACYDRLHLDLGGAHQPWNAALAIRAVETWTGGPLDADKTRAALADVRRLAGLRGRLDTLRLAPRVVADVAHNPAGVAAALAFAQPEVGGRLHVLIGLMRDKDAAAIGRLLAASGAVASVVPLPGDRAMPAADLAAVLRAQGVEATETSDVRLAVEAFARAADPRDTLLVCGSHQVVAALERTFFAETRSTPLC